LVRRATATTAADQDLCSIDTGDILLLGLWGKVTTAIGGGSQDFEIDFDPDDGGSNVALSTLLLVDGDVTDTYYTLNTTFGGALVATLDYAPNAMLAAPFVLPVGDIVLDVTGTEAGSVEWNLVYVPIDAGAVVTAT
jgi:hypothetical protein